MSFYTTSGGPPISEAMYNGGTQLGRDLTFGSADNYAVSLVTGGVAAISIDTSQNVTFAGSITPTGKFVAPAGTAALPSYTFAGDLDTGMYHPAANQLGFSLNGVAVLNVSASRLLYSDAGAGTAASFNRPDDLGLAWQLGNGTNISLGLFKVRDAASTQDNFTVSDAGLVTIGTGTGTTHRINTVVQTTVGAAGGASALPATPTGFIVINVNGTARAVPYYAQA